MPSPPTKLPPSEHRHGCPDERTETYPLQRDDSTTVTAVHCIDCGGIAYYDVTPEEVPDA